MKNANDDGEESFNLHQPIPPAEDGLPPFIKASKPDFSGVKEAEKIFVMTLIQRMTILRFGEKTSLNFRAVLRERNLYKS